jgi:hypothetical protein
VNASPSAEPPQLGKLRYLLSTSCALISIIIHRRSALSGARRLTIQSFIDGPVGFDFLKCQTFAASPAEPGELLFWFRHRYRRRWARETKPNRIKAVRRRQVLKFLHHRHGQCLPDNTKSRSDLQLLLELGLNGPDALRIAPWAEPELESLIAAADDHFAAWSKSNGKPAEIIAERLQVTFHEKKMLGLHHIGCIDATDRELDDYSRGSARAIANTTGGINNRNERHRQ